jgi:hypothetical protein
VAQPTNTPERTDEDRALALYDGQQGVARFDDDTLSGITTVQDAFDLLSQSGSEVESFADEYGSGFEVIENKSALVGREFVIVEWRFTEGDYGPFVSAAIVTRDGQRVIVNDGSYKSGICEQLMRVTEKRAGKGVPETERQRGLVIRKGLRESRYTVALPDKDGNMVDSPSVTYYLT